MNVVDALNARHSVREFLPTPVPKETVMRILEAATRSPSGGNGQPWEVFVAAGATMARIREAYASAGMPAGGPPRPQGPPPPAIVMERMATITRERLELLGLDPTDPDSRRIFMEWGKRLFGAPVLVVIGMNAALSSNLDIGMFIQSVCLAAQDYGVESFIAGAFVSKPDVLRAELGIPDDIRIVTGIGLGYANPDSVINTYRSPRRPIDEVVRYRE